MQGGGANIGVRDVAAETIPTTAHARFPSGAMHVLGSITQVRAKPTELILTLRHIAWPWRNSRLGQGVTQTPPGKVGSDPKGQRMVRTLGQLGRTNGHFTMDLTCLTARDTGTERSVRYLHAATPSKACLVRERMLSLCSSLRRSRPLTIFD